MGDYCSFQCENKSDLSFFHFVLAEGDENCLESFVTVFGKNAFWSGHPMLW